MRREMARRPRRIVFNNDGDDAVYECEEPTAESLLAQRTTPLLGSQVDSIFYCPWCSGFGLTTMRGDVAERFVTTDRIFHRNITGALHEQGTDPSQIMSEFCRAHDLEYFWSLRMNDVHDGDMTPEGDLYYPELFPRFKRDHPSCLVGRRGQAPPFTRDGRCWSSVNFAEPLVRERCFRIIEDAVGRYDIDGIELDFCRHLCYFRSHAFAGEATREDLDAMTELLRRVRELIIARESKLARPLLVAVRVPDSVDYCRDVGLDLEAWLAEELADILIVTDYFRLRPWRASVELGARHDVPVFACLADPRITDEDANRQRLQPGTYRGRAAAAWHAGADAVYVYNLFDPYSPIWREIGDPAALRTTDKTYWASVMGPKAIEYYLVGGERHNEVATLCPDRPAALIQGEPLRVTVETGDEDIAAGPAVTLSLQLQDVLDPGALVVELNDTHVDGGVVDDGWLRLFPHASLLRAGANQITVELARPAGPAPVVRDLRLDVSYP